MSRESYPDVVIDWEPWTEHPTTHRVGMAALDDDGNVGVYVQYGDEMGVSYPTLLLDTREEAFQADLAALELDSTATTTEEDAA